MNLLKICIWFFVIFLNYAIFSANIIVGIIFLLVEIMIFLRFKGVLEGGRRYRNSRRFLNQRTSIESSNATMLVLELMKMEQQAKNIPESSSKSTKYLSEDHKKLRKMFEV